MHKSKMILTLAALSLLCLSGLAHAQTADPAKYPILSLERASLAAGAGYAFLDGNAAALPEFHKEWQVGAYGAYVLTTRRVSEVVGGVSVSHWIPVTILTLSSDYGLDNKTFTSRVGLRVPLYSGGGF